MSQRWRLIFTPVDTWFFRESRPHGAAGADRLESLFPPPVRTVVGGYPYPYRGVPEYRLAGFSPGRSIFRGNQHQ
ncbi:type III-B CRISPR module-associated Cmr3 family protein [Endozoicomonas gorgoniicola]|uniref:type III-B CRISPR module-associated Cmr3 family protein n=1 Tax=Endozoicomonas gorgoniicola TaxID=1234144 RepID=UPI00389963BD